MRTALLLLVLLALAKTVQPAQPPPYYVYNGATLQSVTDDPARATFSTWQAWFYPQNVGASNRTEAVAIATRRHLLEPSD